MQTIGMLLWLSVVQLLNYGFFFLLVLCLIGAAVAQRWRWKGIICMHTCVTALLFVLDISWIGAEMRRPGWDGMPDMDIAFMMGYLMRVFLFNVLLAIVGWYAIRRKSAISLSADQP